MPAGTNTLHVVDSGGLQPGDRLLIARSVTPAWVHFMGMDTLVRNGKPQTWLNGEIRAERVIAAIAGNTITLDVPLSDCLDARYLNPPGCTVVKAIDAGATSEVGVENLNIVAPPQVVGIAQPHHQALRLNGVSDAWVRDVAITDTVDSVAVSNTAQRVTIDNVRINHTVATVGAAKPADFAANGTQILFNRCAATGDNVFYFATGGRVIGPNVLLNCTFHGNGHIQPHMRWATGLLVDGCQVPQSGIDFMNRGIMGSGHGWTMGWAVAWNCAARSYLIQQPPGATNWAIGCTGTFLSGPRPAPKGTKLPVLPSGIIDAPGGPVAPASLYLAQLRARLGEQAVHNIGY